MTRRVSTGLIAAALTLAASCYSNPEDDDDVLTPADAGQTTDDATAGDAAVADSGSRGDAARPSEQDDCEGVTDPIESLICSFGGGLTGRPDAGGGFRLPTTAQCRNPTDIISQLLCGITRRDAGAGQNMRPRDGGRGDRDGDDDARVPDLGPPDSSAPTGDAAPPQDTGVPDAVVPPAEDAAVDGASGDGAVEDAGTDAATEDASSADASATDADVGDADVGDAGDAEVVPPA